MQEQNPLGNYISSIYERRAFADNPFTFNEKLIETEMKEITNPEQFLNRFVLLGNIANDTNVYLEQQFVKCCLLPLLNESKRNQNLIPLFKMWYYGWIVSLNLTRSKGGKERSELAAVGTGYNPRQYQGYGADFQQQQAQENNEEKRNTIQSLLEKFRKRGGK